MTQKGTFHDDAYRKNTQVYGVGEPLDIVAQIPDIVGTGTVLDIGAGQGRNALFLAKKGFSVTALDTSKVGLAQIEEEAKEVGFSIKTKLADIRKEEINISDYSIVIFSFVLHSFLKEMTQHILEKYMREASTGTIHAIAAFTSKGDFYADPKNQAAFYPNPNELERLYHDAGWEIITHREEERITRVTHPDGTSMKNLTTFLLARKK